MAVECPNYKIERPSAPITIERQNPRFKFKFTVTPANTFSGRDHREMAELDDRERHDDHWSSETSTLPELQVLLTRLLRGRGGPH